MASNRGISLQAPDSSAIEWQVLFDAICADGMDQVINYVEADYFSSDERRRIWDVCVMLYNHGEQPTIIGVSQKVGGDFVTRLYSMPGVDRSTYSSIIPHAKMLRNAYARRRAYQAALNLLNLANRPSADEDAVEAEIRSIADGMTDKAHRNESSIGEIVEGIAEKIEARGREGGHTGVLTGFPWLDRQTPFNGFAPGNLVILAARPSVGKTAVMLQMASTAAASGTPAAIFSLEMTEEELGNRLLFSTGLVSPAEVASGQVDWPSFEDAAGLIGGLPIQVNARVREIKEIISRMTVLHRKGMCGIAYIDYLGLVQNSDRDPRQPMYQSLAEITGSLKATAKALEIPVVLLCQLNRDVAKDKDGEPQLFHLRDSGSIEQDADIVLMLQPDPNAVESVPDLRMWVRKNRAGKRDLFNVLRPNDTYTKFYEIGYAEDER